MQSIEVRRTSALIVAIGLIVAALAYVDAQDSAAGQATAVAGQGAAQERSAQAREAEAEIGRTNLAGRVENSLGDAFGGVWFEPATAQMHVGVTSPTSRRLAEAVAARVGLSGIVTETHVASTWAQLEAAQERWNNRLTDLFSRAEVATSIAPDRNAVQVELGSLVSPSVRAELESEASTASVDVSVSVAPGPHLRIERDASRCKEFLHDEAFCDPTIVAGVSIVADEIDKKQGLCTAGPAIIPKDRSTAVKATETYLLTAGHCLDEWGEAGWKWYAYNKEGEKGEKEIGKAIDFLNNNEADIGVIKVNNPGYWVKEKDPIPVVPTIAPWLDQEPEPFSVEKQTKPAQGTRVCMSGEASGVTCGKILKVSVTLPGEPTTEKLVEVEATREQGDSGAPWYLEEARGSVAGTHVGHNNGNPLFEPLEISFELFNEYELLTKANEKRKHPVFTAQKYPVTVSASDASAEDLFTAFGATTKCTETEFHGEMSKAEQEEEPTVIDVTPVYKGCTGPAGVPVTMTNNGCAYEFRLTGEVSENQYSAEAGIVCPEGKPGFEFHVYSSHANLTTGTAMCKLTVPPQSELKSVTLTNSGSNVVIEKGTIEGVKVKIHRNSFLCPSSGTENETTSGVYHNEAVTASGTSGGEADKIDIGSE